MVTMQTLLEIHPELKEVSEIKNMLKGIPESATLPMKLFSATTFLKSHGISMNLFPARIRENSGYQTYSSSQIRPFLVGLLPSEMINPVRQALSYKFPEYVNNPENIFLGTQRNLTEQLDSCLDKMESPEELPEIFISSGFNSLYNFSFLLEQLNEQQFEILNYPPDSYFTTRDLEHPYRLMNLYSGSLQVMVINKKHFGNQQAPSSWYELLSPKLKNSLIMDKECCFSCNAVLYSFFAEYGPEAIRVLGQNTHGYRHPSEMLNEINSNSYNSNALYIMPYTYANKVRNINYEMVWPGDGAILNPVQILIRKRATKNHLSLLKFLCGKAPGELLEQSGFPALLTSSIRKYPGRKIKWLGWDFIYNHDMHKIKTTIKNLFSDEEK